MSTRRTTHRLVGATVLAVLLSVGAQAGTAQSAPPTEANLKAWETKLAQVSHPSANGCFTANYPQLTWHETKCVSTPSTPMAPKRRLRPLVVGNGNSISAQSPGGNITEAFGSFENIMNVTSESSPTTEFGAPVANAYSLQLNTNFFTSAACAGSPNPGCQGWEQFVFSNDGASGSVFIQYWLLRYNAACPDATWFTFSFAGDPDIYCYKNSPGAVRVPNQPITNLGNLRLSGHVTTTSDSVILLVGGTAYSTPGSNAVGAAAGWTKAEFNVFGFAYGHAATFNPGASLNVRTRIHYGGTAAPICAAEGFTGETNNLNFGTPRPAFTPPGPAVIFLENTAGGAVTNCAAAAVIGDTHQHTFGGLLYDFQASGDFVEAQVGSSFEVQTRKVSGAPTWPNTSVNQSVATRMGSTRVALCDGQRLVVDGQSAELPSGKSLSLPSGVDIHRVGNVYFVSDQTGNSIRVTVNSGYIDMSVGLGTWPVRVRGLLGNPDNKPDALEARDGTRFTVPISFEDLYRKFGESWRVSPMRTLLALCAPVASGNPAEPFLARDLDPELRQRAQNVCLQAKVAQEWLDTCTLDVAVLGEKAAATYVGMAPPVLDGNR
ncbi:VWD domain-containing protein [Allorhizocola rhizosphaerae]|uniref:VWD domain-containing protein n=1 Tax=Allorhizocola rhizosphaerae TaxID=1872709 RepID=UPI000E3E0383|nr:VWD domain-containing protein [Allorhizocola rhizosphaerae]